MSHRYLVLGMLSEAPMTGYEIKKRVDTSLRSFAQTSYGTLYPTLHRLLQDGAVRMEEHVRPRRPARKVYEITDLGRQELDRWLQEPTDGQERRDFLLRLFMGHALSADRLCTLLQQRRASVQAEMQALQADGDRANGNTPDTQDWVLDYALTLYTAELDWLNRLMAQMESGLSGHSHLST